MTVYTTATATNNEAGPLRKVVNAFTAVQAKILSAGVKSPADWEPMSDYLEVKTFKRVGAYLEEFNFTEYCEFLAGWAAGGTQFEFTEFHVTEVGDTLFQEIEERHTRGDAFIRKNVIETIKPGETVTNMNPGGGGYGDPYERPTASVLADVKNSLVSIEGAREDYGVVIGTNGALAVDEAASATLRAAGAVSRTAGWATDQLGKLGSMVTAAKPG